MANARCQGFRLRDGLILIVGLGVGLAMVIEFRRGESMFMTPAMAVGFLPSPKDSFEAFVFEIKTFSAITIYYHSIYIMPAVGPIGIAVLVCRLLPPRPRFRRFMREPGFVALLAATLVLLAWLPPFAFNLVKKFRQGVNPSAAGLALEFITQNIANGIACAVMASWVALYFSGRWRANRDWTDRLGRLLGVFWIVPAIAWPLCWLP